MKTSNDPQHSLAIVIPFTDWQFEDVQRQMKEIWTLYPPCNTPVPLTDIFLYFHRDITLKPHILSRLMDAFEQLPSRHCFHQLHFMNAGLTLEQDLYPLGASRMFFKLFKSKKLAAYDFMFIMEPDTFACQKNWLMELHEQCLRKFWIRGSIIRDNHTDIGLHPFAQHINGNALYAIGSMEFKEFVSLVEHQFFMHPQAYLEGYDVAFYMVRQERQHFHWINYTRTIHLFQYSNFIQNVYRTPVNASKLCIAMNETFLVHGRHVHV